MQNPLVSVIVPCYNQAHYLDESLTSILNQTYPHWECMIINDGSPDHTEAIAQSWVAKDSRFIYLTKENGGVSSARNLGIENAKGELILTLDADDKYEVSFMEKALQVLLEKPEIGIVSSWGMYFSGNKNHQIFQSKATTISDFLFYNGLNMGSSMYRKACWEKAGKYDGDTRNGYEDWEFYLRVCALGWKVHIIEEVLFYYRQHTISRRKEMNKVDFQNKKYIFMANKSIYFDHFEEWVDRYLTVADLEKEEMNKFKNTIDYKLGHAILKPMRAVKWFCISVFKSLIV